ncbi:WD40 repeat domain-containing protein [Chitinibacter sp. GC72]|uniref:WD40 repeat domain-containing protein n=1 Tax=Chitinibacter sp. GC72 TaxID=1526917 RepID=UPI0012FB63BB|nr:WD40 repeat domain-containing protein [Chitinibacter sp. GC72]
MLRDLLFAASVQGKGDTFIKLPDTVDLSLTSRFSAVFSPDGARFVTTGSSTNKVRVYNRSGDTFTLAQTLSPVASTVRRSAFSPDGQFLAVVGAAGTYDSAVTVYKYNGSSFVITDSQSLAGMDLQGCVFTPDGAYLLLVHHNGAYLYKRDAGATKYSNAQGVFDNSTYRSVAVDPSGVYFVLAGGGAVKMYKRSGDTLTLVYTVPSLATAHGVAYSDTGNYVAVVGEFSGYIKLFQRSGDTLVALPAPAVLPTYYPTYAAFSSGGAYLAVSSYSQPSTIVYKRSGSTFTKLPDFGTPTPTNMHHVDFSPDADYLAATTVVGSGQGVFIYKRT